MPLLLHALDTMRIACMHANPPRMRLPTLSRYVLRGSVKVYQLSQPINST
jgi:hypothetical protein